MQPAIRNGVGVVSTSHAAPDRPVLRCRMDTKPSDGQFEWVSAIGTIQARIQRSIRSAMRMADCQVQEPVYTIKQLAELSKTKDPDGYGVTGRTIHRDIKNGKLKAHPQGKGPKAPLVAYDYDAVEWLTGRYR